ncbi:MAG: DUF2806 domain-containing protein [Chloroflexi bacterium]|nr:DUF2806 domain-containing protein [Chloroflexota bacterium]MYE40793.1 DUF2806 domain-containing protein [Chloroflexota bacterium]
MDERDFAEAASPVFRAVAPSFFSAFGNWLRPGQQRKNLEADRSVVEGLLKAGQTNFRFSGIEMNIEFFNDAHREEVERQVSNVLNAMLKADSIVDWSKVDLARFNPEFRHRWTSEASNVSDETLQNLWAQLLKGELESPGSLSNDTMSVARDLNKERAEEFQVLCSAALCSLDGTPSIVVGCGNPRANSLRPFGLSYDVLMRLAHHRLIVNDMTSYITVGEGSGELVVLTKQQESTWLLRWSNGSKRSDEDHRIKGILFTPAGAELFAVVEKIPNPEYTAAMLKSLKQDGWVAVPVTNAP